MTENFNVVKNKYRKLAIISSVALGVLCGVIVACALLLAFKLSAIALAWYYYLVIGIGVSALSCVPFYFLMRPSDKKLAIKLDGEYALNQKVQTMVEFACAEGALVSLQREQTDEVLSVAAKKMPDLKGLLKYAFVPVMAIAVGVCAVVVPAKKVTVYQPAFTLSATQRTALNNLVSDVNDSELTPALKTVTTSALTDMLGKLEKATLQSEMKQIVITSIRSIDFIISGANSYLPVYEALKGEELSKPFAVCVAECVTYYKNTMSSVIKTLDGVNTQIDVSDGITSSMLDEWQATFKKSFSATTEEGVTTGLMTSVQMAQKAGEYSSAFKSGLLACTFTGEGDALISAISAFADDVVTVSSDWGAEGYLTQLELKAEAFITPAVEDALSVQTYSCLMDEFVRNRTAEIMGVKLSEIGDNTSVAPDISDSEGEGDGGTQGGGYGSGGIIYAGDDMVLDPDSGELVSYGTLMARYRAKIRERISEYEAVIGDESSTAEEIAEAKYVLGELSKYVTQYFDKLSVSNEKE